MEQSPFSKFDHVGIVVRDMDKAVEYYQSLGIGPLEPSKRAHLVTDRKVYGKPADDVKTKSRITQIGQSYLEMIQPVSGESIQKKFLEAKGEGINHLGLFMDNLEKEVVKLNEE